MFQQRRLLLNHFSDSLSGPAKVRQNKQLLRKIDQMQNTPMSLNLILSSWSYQAQRRSLSVYGAQVLSLCATYFKVYQLG